MSKSKSSLGRSLMNARKPKKQPKEAKFQHTDDIDLSNKKNKLESIIDQNNLCEFLQQAELSSRQFEAAKETKVKGEGGGETVIIDLNSIKKENPLPPSELLKSLRIPRRPKWDQKTTPELLSRLEGEAFLNWRRNLAQIEETYYNLQITPYEKNIEVWKQLWRVIEKSDIVVQIVDGRDPFFFRCLDLEHYVKEVDSSKLNLLLINKSDLLSSEIRAHWNAYLLKNNIPHLFFSAKEEQEKIDKIPNDKKILEKDEGEKSEELKSHEFKQEEELLDQSNENSIKSKNIQSEITLTQASSLANTPNLVSRQTLLSTLKFLVQTLVIPEKNKEKHEKQSESPPIDINNAPKHNEESKKNNENVSKHKSNLDQLSHPKIHNENQGKQEVSPNIVTIGMVGYPNVGKSSVINVLCGKKLVGVASRPGKTKHFQTIFLEKDLILCDCPGLVFPSANSSRAEMVCNGVLPIDNVKDYISPIELLARQIEKKVFEKVYNVKLESFVMGGQSEEESAKEQTEYTIGTHILTTIAKKRGFFTGGSGLPDQAKVAKMVLKDFVNGRLIYCKLNPEYSVQVEGRIKGINGYIEIEDEIYDTKQNDGNKKEKLNEKLGGKKKEEGLKKRNEEQLDSFFKEEREGAKEDLDEEDLLELLEGRVVKGVKLNKIMRREIKFALKRGEKFDINKFLRGKESFSLVKTIGKSPIQRQDDKEVTGGVVKPKVIEENDWEDEEEDIQ